MRINRLKRIQKSLNFYVNNFGFRKPYRILIDGTFCFTALKDKLDIQDQLKNYLGDEIQLITTPCVVLETEKLGKSVFGAMLIVKKFPAHKCAHNDKPVPGSACFQSMIGKHNSNRYIVATQDRDLQEWVRSKPGVPLLYFFNKAPTLEAPSTCSLETAQVATANPGISKYEETVLNQLKKSELGIEEDESKKSKKRKKKRGANPLSCKKKKMASDVPKPAPLQAESKKKRTRKRIKIAKHVKEELMLMKKSTNI